MGMYIIAHCSSHLNRNQPSQTHTPISTVGILTMCRIAISTTSSFPGLLHYCKRYCFSPVCLLVEWWHCLLSSSADSASLCSTAERAYQRKASFWAIKTAITFSPDRDPSYFLSILSSSAHYSRRLHSEISCAQMQFSKHILDQNHCTLLAFEQGDAIQIKPFVLDFGVHNCKVPSLPLEYECISSYRLLN